MSNVFFSISLFSEPPENGRRGESMVIGLTAFGCGVVWCLGRASQNAQGPASQFPWSGVVMLILPQQLPRSVFHAIWKFDDTMMQSA